MALPRYSPREMIEKLVGFDTTSRFSNLELITFIEDYLSAHGIAHERIESADGRKTNLYATLGDLDMPGGIVLSGHTDVVPVDDQEWSSNPFQVREHDGKLYGRGTCDMKSFVAVVLALIPNFSGRVLKRPVHLALSYDEEVGCLGVRDMLAHIAKVKPKPAFAIIGEPSDMKVVNAHKAIRGFETVITGREAHSSATHFGLNAVMIAAELIHFLNQMDEEMRARGDASGRFMPPFTSVHVGVVEGGTAQNIIPRHCRIVWEYRCLPGSDEDEIIRRFNVFAQEKLSLMRQIAPEADIVTHMKAAVPALAPQPGSEAEHFAKLIAQRNEAEAVSYGTEAGLFQNAGIPAIVCGPGNILQAHRPDEFVALSQIEACETFMRRFIEQVCEA